jgi:hypothetical protein
LYKKWLLYTETHPYASIIITALTASLIGISIEYLLNQDFVSGGFWVTLTLVIGQLLSVRRKNRKK